MEKYVNRTIPGMEIFRLEGKEDISDKLRDEDIRHVGGVLYYLRQEWSNPQIFLVGEVIDSWRRKSKDYGNVELFTVFDDEEKRQGMSQKLVSNSKRFHGSLGIEEIPVLYCGRYLCLVTQILTTETPFLRERDKSFLLEPVRESPTMGVVPVASPINLSLISLQKFSRNYNRAYSGTETK